MQEGTAKTYEILANRGISLNGSKLGLLLACPFSKDKSEISLEILGKHCLVSVLLI